MEPHPLCVVAPWRDFPLPGPGGFSGRDDHAAARGAGLRRRSGALAHGAGDGGGQWPPGCGEVLDDVVHDLAELGV